MKAKLHLVLSISISLWCFCTYGQQNYWKHKSSTAKNRNEETSTIHYFELDQESFTKLILDSKTKKEQKIVIPTSSKDFETFEVVEQSNFAPVLQKKYPNIMSVIGWNGDKTKTIALSHSSKGASISLYEVKSGRLLFLEKTKKKNTYQLYTKQEQLNQKAFVCKTQQKLLEYTQNNPNPLVARPLRTFRLAVSTTGEYAQYHGGTKEGALEAINSTLTRINFVFKRDLGVQLQLIENNENIIYTNKDNDPYDDDLSGEVQATLTQEIGEENYDIGHLFHRDFNNGNAGGIGTVCKDGRKGSAFASALVPEGDLYDLDYVAHEMGHQFGANHTWSYESENTGVQVEPGSGSTIMAYAGIVEGNNVAQNGDDYFHAQSIVQIGGYLNQINCSTNQDSENQPPIWSKNLGLYYIPSQTPFVLSNKAIDDSANVLTYTWEQVDDGVVSASNFGPENPTGANFRSIRPSTLPQRYFPNLNQVLAGDLTQTNPQLGDSWETLSNISRDYTFVGTVRDNDQNIGQINLDTVVIRVVSSNIPFAITSWDTPQAIIGGSLQDITWNVAGTSQEPFSVQEVSILLSQDGGQTFDLPLAQRIPNTGFAKVQFPNVEIEEARLQIKAEDNLFFAVNSINFAVTSIPLALRADQIVYEICDQTSLAIPFTLQIGTTDERVFIPYAQTPSGVTTNFSTEFLSPENPNLEVVLEGLENLNPGDYEVFIGVDGESSSFEIPITLKVLSTVPATPVLVTPEEKETDLGSSVRFSWQTVPDIDRYLIEISEEAEFQNLFKATTTLENNITVNGLSPVTTYYWRVKSFNDCGSSSFSSISQFTTANISCQEFTASPLPLEISEEGTPTVRSTITVRDNLPIQSLSVRVNLDHTYVQDLIITLIAPNGARILLVSNACNNGQNINATFESSGANLICTNNPAINGSIKPLGSFEDLVGLSTQGQWILEVKDTAAVDGGMLNRFEIEFCVSGQFRPDADADGIFDDGEDECLNTPMGDIVDDTGCKVVTLPQDLFDLEITPPRCPEDKGIITIRTQRMDPTFTALLTGNVEQTKALEGGMVSFENLNPGAYTLCINTNDADYQPACYEITIEQGRTLEIVTTYSPNGNEVTLELSGGFPYELLQNGNPITVVENEVTLILEEGVNLIALSSSNACLPITTFELFKSENPIVFPNPARDQTKVWFGTSKFVLKTGLFNTQGKLMWSNTPFERLGELTIPLSQLPLGTYILLIETDQGNLNFQIFKEY